MALAMTRSDAIQSYKQFFLRTHAFAGESEERTRPARSQAGAWPQDLHPVSMRKEVQHGGGSRTNFVSLRGWAQAVAGRAEADGIVRGAGAGMRGLAADMTDSDAAARASDGHEVAAETGAGGLKLRVGPLGESSRNRKDIESRQSRESHAPRVPRPEKPQIGIHPSFALTTGWTPPYARRPASPVIRGSGALHGADGLVFQPDAPGTRSGGWRDD